VRYRGVCYDVGRVMLGQNWRPDFLVDEVHKELEIIREDLHCNAVRVCGQDVERWTRAAEEALRLGLTVWLAPELWDRSPEETLAYVADAAHRAEALRRQWPDRVVFSVGSELTLFMQGILEGDSVLERLQHPTFWERIRSGAHREPLQAFLAEACARVRQVFHGPVTYASVPLEPVDWSLFDFVCVDLYREARIRDRFPDLLRSFFSHGRPVVITEFGCCTYRGAADAGSRGWAIVDPDKTPPHWLGTFVRDEAEQARELGELLAIFEAAGVEGTFVMTFSSPRLPTSTEPRQDLDLASYSLVKSYTDRTGTAYPGLPWDPKQSFGTVAAHYARSSA